MRADKTICHQATAFVVILFSQVSSENWQRRLVFILSIKILDG